MSRRRGVVVVVAVVVVAAVFGWAGSRPDAANTRVHAGEEASTAPSIAGSAPTPTPSVPSATRRPAAAVAATMAALPPAGADPAAVVEALLADADAGDRRAACRVAIELVTCQWAEAMIGERWVRGDIALFHGAGVAAEQARFDDAIAAAHARCAAIPAATRARTAELLGAAARAGEPDAALLYAQGMHLVGHTTRDFIAHPGFDRWRTEAAAMVWRQFRAGDRRAVFMLAIGYDGHMGLLEGLIDDDPVTARAMWLLGARLRGRAHGSHRALAPADEARAAELAARWHHEHFDGRVTGEDLDTATLVPPMPWSPPTEEPERCTGVVPD